MAAASLIVSLVALAAAGWSTYVTLREARKANAIPGLLDFISEYRHYEQQRRYITLELAEKHPDPSVGTSELSADARDAVMTVSHYLDQLGVIVHRGLIEPSVVAGFMGRSVLSMWTKLSPYIKQERVRRGEEYQRYFEHLAALMAEFDQTEVSRPLKQART